MRLVKQIIVIRKDLKMRRGKEIAQGAHASMAFIINRLKSGLHAIEKLWMDQGHRKICVQVASEQELLDLNEKAKTLGIEAHLIKDSGLTEFHGPTFTALALGPDYDENLDKITKSLKLY